MRVLLCSTPMLGHFNPMVPLAWALRAAGHEVLAAASEDFAGQVCERGLPVASLPAVDFKAVMGRDRQGRPVPYHGDAEERVLRSGRGWGRLGAHLLDGMSRIVSGWKPDLVVVDPVEYAGRLAAARRGIPVVEHAWGVWPDPLFAVGAQEELAPELERLGLGSLPVPDERLDFCSPSLQRKGVSATAMRYVSVAGPAMLPKWLDEPRHRPLVCLTFGSILPKVNPEGMLDLTSRLAEIVPTLGVDVAIATDRATAAQLSPVPPGVVAAGWLPMDLVVPACAAVLHYGGAGVTMMSTAAAVPQLVVELPVADAPEHARRVAAAGLGICIEPSALSADTVTEALGDLLGDDSWRARAAEVAAEQEGRPLPIVVAEELAARWG
ncbi:glycosyltransferase [Kitasatospora sp. NPDC001540]|uniref:glycosyltransferase n=1 Tax=Kitasatospora sp. NPDC001540 TaxID=3364014 RepID=UPI0036D1FE74